MRLIAIKIFNRSAALVSTSLQCCCCCCCCCCCWWWWWWWWWRWRCNVQELQQVKDGSYMSDLYRIVTLGTRHVVKCERCSACGFICEICNDDSDVIYPFDVASTITVCTHTSFFYIQGGSKNPGLFWSSVTSCYSWKKMDMPQYSWFTKETSDIKFIYHC